MSLRGNPPHSAFLIHAPQISLFLSHVLSLYADGKSDAALAALDEMLDWLWQIEDEIHPQFDTVLFRQRISQLLKM